MLPPSTVITWAVVRPACASAIADTGAVGRAAMVSALRTYLIGAGRTVEAERLSGGLQAGLRSWAGLVLREKRAGRDVPGPNSEPWQHLAPVGD